ncbi:MAG: hypothetical protein K5872_03365 [Rhizobiaceae bacterium]|nr:hypothetical protein [Rhizobiaceae bacterium]MCV0405249.1 hypothetical protein [Rhizobiaceae bacterium]
MQQIGVQGFRFLMALLLVGISTTSAHAYLDPGTGSIILQLLLGGVAGVALAGKLYWHKFLSLIGAGGKVEMNEQQRAKGGMGADERGR